MRTSWLGSLLALAAGLGCDSAMAAPLQWQMEGGTSPSATGPGRPLVWTVEREPQAATGPTPATGATAAAPGQSTASAATPPATAGQGSTTTPGAPGAPAAQAPASAAKPTKAAPANPDQPNKDGYPPFGVPVEPAFPLPYIGGAVPSAYVGGWGTYWFGLSGGTPGKLRAGSVDASFNAGIGFGDFYKTIAVELDLGIGSIKNLGANGGFSVSAGRLLVDQPRLQVAVAGGVQSLYTYGNEGNPEPSSGYGVVTFATPLRPGNYNFAQVLQLSLGVGGYQFAYLDPNTFASDGTGAFAALGMQITSNVGLSLGWSNRGSNVNLSYTPFRHLPIYLNVVAADVFNVSPSGTVAVFSISWGDDFRTALF